MKFAKFQQILSSFNFVTNLGPTGAKYLIIFIFDFTIEICIFEISIVPRLNEAFALLIIGKNFV